MKLIFLFFLFYINSEESELQEVKDLLKKAYKIIESLEKASMLDDAMFNEALEAMKIANYAEAKKIFVLFIKNKKNVLKASLYLGECLFLEKKYEKASYVFNDLFNKLIMNVDDESIAILKTVSLKLIKCLFFIGRTIDANNIFDKMKEKFPEWKNENFDNLYSNLKKN